MSKSGGKKSFRIDDLLSRKSVVNDPVLRSQILEDSLRENTKNNISKVKSESSHHQNENSPKFHASPLHHHHQHHHQPQSQLFTNPGEELRQHIWEDSSSIHEIRKKQQESMFRYNHGDTTSSINYPQLPAPLPFGPLGHYRGAMQRTTELVQIPFPFYNSHPGLPPISAFSSFCPSDGEELVRRHQASALYEASLAYLGTNPSTFSMTSLLSGSGSKRKGGQIRFTNYQTSQLEKSFTEHKYLNATDRKKLANSLALSDRQVKTWFQNRRAKWRKTKEISTEIEGEVSKSSYDNNYSPDGHCDSSAAAEEP